MIIRDSKGRWAKGSVTGFLRKPGWKHTEETKKSLSETHKKMKKPWAISPSKGKKDSEETRLKKRLAQIERYNREGRKSLTELKRYGDDAKDRRCSAYAVWRKLVWERDGFSCKILNVACSGRIEAHHILGWTDYPELRYEVNNGITLCHFHHPRKRNDEMRLSPYFKELIKQ